MKKINKILFAAALAIMLVFTGCDGLADGLAGIDLQITSFTADDTSITAGEKVNFSIEGTNVDESVENSTTDYGVSLKITDDDGNTLWSDSVSSSIVKYSGFNETTSVTFDEAGTYVITLTATAKETGTTVESDTITITVEEAPEYTVTFDSNGGSDVESQTVTSGDKITSVTPTRDGYTFDGWYTSSYYTTKWNSYSTVTEDITLYAKWTQDTVEEEEEEEVATTGSTFDSAESVYFSSSLSDSSKYISIPSGGEYWIKTTVSASDILAISGKNASTTIRYTIYNENESSITEITEVPDYDNNGSFHYYAEIVGDVYIKFETYGFAGSFYLKLGDDPNHTRTWG